MVGEHPVYEGIEATVEVEHEIRDGRQVVQNAPHRPGNMPVVQQVPHVERQHAHTKDRHNGHQQANDSPPGCQAPLSADPAMVLQTTSTSDTSSTTTHSRSSCSNTTAASFVEAATATVFVYALHVNASATW